MGSANAFVMVGRLDSVHNGIYSTHCLILHENDRLWWILTPIFRFPNECKPENCEIVIWIPTVEHMLEDALLMICIYVLKDKKLVSLAKKFFKNRGEYRIWLYEDIDRKDLKKLRDVCRELLPKYNVKIVVTITLGSTILRHKVVLQSLEEIEIIVRRGILGEFEEYDILKRW